MAQNKKQHFIVVDDSKLDCFIAEKIVKNTGKCESVISFHMAHEALKYIESFQPEGPNPTIILVDIQMPLINGFQFVEAFDKLPSHITEHYRIFIISSSINDDDLSRVHNYKSIREFLNKPLTSNNLSALLSKD